MASGRTTEDAPARRTDAAVSALDDPQRASARERRDAVRRLFAAGLLTPEDAVRRGIEALDRSRSHFVLMVRVGGAGGYAVKRATPPTSAYHGTGEREAFVYALAATRPELARWLPERFLRDAPELLVLERIEGAETLAEFHHRVSGHPLGLAAAQAEALAAWHGVARRPGTPLPARRPWVLGVGNGELPDLVGRDPRLREAVANATARSAVRSGLRRAATSWRCDALVHGDLKWDNWLVQSDEGCTPRLFAVDWELADWGDVAWDLGASVGNYLSCLGEAPGPAAPGVARLGRRSGFDGVAPAAARLLERYLEAASAPVDSREALCRRAVEMAGAWLVQLGAQSVGSHPSSEAWAHADTWSAIAEDLFAGAPEVTARLLDRGAR